MTDALDAKVSSLVGGKTATGLEKAFGIYTVGDLLGHYPRRYARRGELTAIADADAAKWALTPIPLYPATSTVASWQIAKMMQLVLPVAAEVADPVPAELSR